MKEVTKVVKRVNMKSRAVKIDQLNNDLRYVLPKYLKYTQLLL